MPVYRPVILHCLFVIMRCLQQRPVRRIITVRKGAIQAMISENLKSFRKAKGFTQEELAARLNVARQTISKWEKGLSVPDADTLIRVAEILEVSTSKLLGSQVKENVDETTIEDIAEQLSRVNEQLAIKNRRSHRIWKTLAIIVAVIIAINILLVIFSLSATIGLTRPVNGNVQPAEEQIIDPGN